MRYSMWRKPADLVVAVEVEVERIAMKRGAFAPKRVEGKDEDRLAKQERQQLQEEQEGTEGRTREDS
jgi:hypothetical protein